MADGQATLLLCSQGRCGRRGSRLHWRVWPAPPGRWGCHPVRAVMLTAAPLGFSDSTSSAAVGAATWPAAELALGRPTPLMRATRHTGEVNEAGAPVGDSVSSSPVAARGSAVPFCPTTVPFALSDAPWIRFPSLSTTAGSPVASLMTVPFCTLAPGMGSPMPSSGLPSAETGTATPRADAATGTPESLTGSPAAFVAMGLPSASMGAPFGPVGKPPAQFRGHHGQLLTLGPVGAT